MWQIILEPDWNPENAGPESTLLRPTCLSRTLQNAVLKLLPAPTPPLLTPWGAFPSVTWNLRTHSTSDPAWQDDSMSTGFLFHNKCLFSWLKGQGIKYICSKYSALVIGAYIFLFPIISFCFNWKITHEHSEHICSAKVNTEICLCSYNLRAEALTRTFPIYL